MPDTLGWRGAVDANILIGAYIKDYPPTAFPGVWQFLDHRVNSGRLALISTVQPELLHPDELVDRVRSHAQHVAGETEDLEVAEPYERVIGCRTVVATLEEHPTTSHAVRMDGSSPSAA